MSPSRVAPRSQRGPLMAIGGAEDKTPESLVLKRFWALAGGQAAQIVILPTASALDEAGEDYASLFESLGVERAEVVQIRKRSDAMAPEAIQTLEGATAIFITGGNQLKLAAILGGTPIAQQLRRMNAQGVPIGGSSAGASILADHMVAYGRNGSAPYQRMINFAPGLGLTNRLIIDQHFSQRRRFGRLMAAVAHNPFLLGVGLDEDTSILLESTNCMRVIGRRSVVIIDGADLLHTDIHDVKAHAPIAIIGLRFHVLTHGCSYNIGERRPCPPAEDCQEEP